MRLKLITLLLLCSVTAAQDRPRGIGQAGMPLALSTRNVLIRDMRDGEERYALDEAVFVDGENKVWLVANAVTFGERENAKQVGALNVTIRRNRLGYFIDFPFHYKVVNGYSVPVHPTWQAGGHATKGYHIAALSARQISPVYEEAPYLKRLEQILASGKRPPRPSFTTPVRERKTDADFLLDSIARVRPSGTGPDAGPSPGGPK